MGLSRELSCEAGSSSHCCNFHRFLLPGVLRVYLPTLESWVLWSVSLPSCSFWFICMKIWGHPIHQQLPCRMSSPFWLPVSTSPTSLDECFFFNFLVVGLPYSSIFWQFWLFFVVKFVVFLLVVQGVIVYLPIPSYWSKVRMVNMFFFLMVKLNLYL